MNKQKKKMNASVLLRVLKMLYKFYPVLLPLTAVFILFSAVTAAIPAVFTQKVIAIIIVEMLSVSCNRI